jgi:predicted PurR-regulated permease PerM
MASSALRVLLLGAVVAGLYLAREVLIPLALAVLFSFLLAPIARRLEALHLGRALSTVAVVTLFVLVLAGVGWAAGNQMVSVIGKLPEYRQHIAHKLEALRSPPKDGDLGKAARAIKQLEKDIKPGSKPPAEPQPVSKIAPLPTTPLELIGALGLPLVTLAGMAVAVIVITALILLQRDDLRERLMRLVGEGHIHLTTQAMEEAAGRVSRYLITQLVVNIGYGLPLAVAFYFIGLPNALLWGLLATVLRFIPYLGASIAAALPIILALAISDGWTTVAWTAGAIAVMELIVAYGVEPFLYGATTGLSPIAIVFSAIFWTWLWGPIGLLLATPMTVCLAVAGRHVPQLGFLNVLLGVEPVLPDDVRLYQRLLAFEYDEALELADKHAREHGLADAFEALLLPALFLAKRDRLHGRLDREHEGFVFDSLQRIVEDLEGPENRGQTPVSANGQNRPQAVSANGQNCPQAVSVCIVPAHDQADYVAGFMLARLLPDGAVVLPKDMLASEILERIERDCRGTVIVSAMPPSAASNAAYVAKRLHARFPHRRIVIALWTARGNLERIASRLKDSGAADVLTTFSDAISQARLAPRVG